MMKKLGEYNDEYNKESFDNMDWVPQVNIGMARDFPSQGSEFSEEEINTFFAFAKEYPEEIRNVRNDAIKVLMLNKWGLKHFLDADVTLISVVPHSYKNPEEKLKAIEEYTKDKPYLIITSSNLQGADKHTLDSYKGKYPNQCIHLSSYQFQPVKDILAIAGKTNNDFSSKSTLVFIGPTLANSSRIADCDPSKITNCVKAHGNIERVELMGYNTAGVKGSVEDKEGLLGRVAEEFSKNQITDVDITAYKGEGYSYANIPIPSLSSPMTFFGSTRHAQDQRGPLSETTYEVLYKNNK